MKLFKSKKGFEMTIPLLIGIILGLIVLAVMIYLIMGKSKLFSESTTCPEDTCVLGIDPCKDGYTKGFVACKKTDTATGKKTTGRCCVPEDSS